MRSTDVEKLRERAASTESLAAVARRNQARRTVSRPPGSLTPRRTHYLQGRLSRRDPFCTESIRGGIGLNHAPVELFANQSPFGVVPGTNRSDWEKPAGPELRSNAGLRVRVEHAKKLTMTGFPCLQSVGTRREQRDR